MKPIKFFFASILALTFAACSNTENDDFDNNASSFESMVSTYGIQMATPSKDISDVPSVTTEEMGSVLEALRRSGNTARECELEISEGFYSNGSDRETVKMNAGYRAQTNNGAFVGQFDLSVALNFNIDKGSVYYVGTTYSSSTSLFGWEGYGVSLSTTADGESVFNSTAYLYFRVSDRDNQLVKVQVVLEGSYNFESGKGMYHLGLSR
ncbi:DUF5033 domain-containing protein [Bacteroides sp. UBA939]|uniref:DUF5033 domain-containing protein n=1 Tax=Bacteroides sp. UBA939 TaxID=1946092 RepID=UPI0025C035A0|nr:DUF5033 domain-containing protein [Bacteroides sp. UBA939]